MRITDKSQPITISVIGAGNRAKEYLKVLDREYEGLFEVVAIFEPKIDNQDYFRQQYDLTDSQIYDSYQHFLNMDRISDVVIIATLDDMHLEPTLAAIDKDYDIILEKPISISLEETILISEAAKGRDDQLIAVCHVLRHSPFFKKLKEIVDSKVLGEVVDIQHNENIGYYHFAHSYVRGNWRNTKIAAPLIVAKSCHDMDILLYLLGNKHAERVASFGSLSFFNKNHYLPEKMSHRCEDCKIEPECPYSALKIYSSGKMKSVVFDNRNVESLIKDLKGSNYGVCVFDSDNNVNDNQVSIIEFSDGVHATFNLSAFSNNIHRTIKIMCQYGEIRGNEFTKEIEIAPFGKEKEIIKIDKLAGGHGGADTGFMRNFMKTYLDNTPFDSTLEMSIESHVMAFAADYSDNNQGVPVTISDFYQKTLKEMENLK